MRYTHLFRPFVFVVVVGLFVMACAPAAPVSAPVADQTAQEAATSAPSGQKVRQSFGGGPVGGAFQVFANAMSLIMSDADPNLEIAAEGTGGSAENLRSVNSGDIQYGIVYSGDIYLGRQGLLADDPNVYADVRPVAALYGGVIHLVVTEASGIQTVADLEGKRIAPGNAGSGAALSAERYFKHLGLWDKMNIEYLGYSQAASAMGDGQLDGFWILAAFPNASVTEATTVTKIKLLDTATPGDESGFFEAYPFYAKRALLGGFYDNVPEDVPSFQDTAIWVAHKDVPDDLVYNALKAVFSEEGLKRMREAHPAAAEMTIESGLVGIPVALHPGAYRFWQEQGVEIADVLIPSE